MCLDLRAVTHWFVAALLGGAEMGGSGVMGSISRIWWVYSGDLGIFLMREVGSQGRWGQVRFEFTFFSG